METTPRFSGIVSSLRSDATPEASSVARIRPRTTDTDELMDSVRGSSTVEATALLKEWPKLSLPDASALAGVLLASSASGPGEKAPEKNKIQLLLDLLQSCKIDPEQHIIYKIARSGGAILDFACQNADEACRVYYDLKDMPKSFTCAAVGSQLNANVKVPALDDSKPFLLSATDRDGLQKMVKLLRFDPASPLVRDVRMAEAAMEVSACDRLHLSSPQKGFIQAEVIEVDVPSRFGADVGTGGSKIQAIVMPKYVGTVATSAKFFFPTLAKQGRIVLSAIKTMHSSGLVHMDVKGDNIFVDWQGNWLIGDFGSCKDIGDLVGSTTKLFYFENLNGKRAVPEIDYFMILVVLLIDTLSDKHKFQKAFHDTGSAYINKDKVLMYARNFPRGDDGLRVLFQEIIDLL